MSAAQRAEMPLYIIRYSRRFFDRLALSPAVKNPLNCRKAAGADFGGLFLRAAVQKTANAAKNGGKGREAVLERRRCLTGKTGIDKI